MTVGDLLTEAARPDPGAWARSRRRLPRLGGSFALGLVLLLWPLVAAFVGGFLVDPAELRIAAAPPGTAPSTVHPLGSDSAGRDILALLIQGTPPTFLIGFLAGGIATALGTIIGMISGYARGFLDSILRGVVDVMLGLPALAVAIIVAAILGDISTIQLGILIAALIWAFPARQVRGQVLSLREQQFVFISRLSNQGPLRIIFLEILPNILPFVMAAFVASVSFSILVAIGLQLLGLGSAEPTLGLVLQLAIGGGALSRGMWWWWAPPALILVSIFIGLFLVSTAVDRFANPRLREVRADG
jgi:peptide/nickel transport system permease protein